MKTSHCVFTSNYCVFTNNPKLCVFTIASFPYGVRVISVYVPTHDHIGVAYRSAEAVPCLLTAQLFGC